MADNENPQTDESLDTEAVEPPSKGLSAWGWVAIGCGTLVVLSVIAIVLFVLLIVKATSGPVEVANLQLAAIKNGETRKAYNYGSIDFKNSVSYTRFKEFINANPSIKENKSASFNKRNIENNVATISGTLESDKGAVTPVEYRFVKENGEWRILFINLNQPRE